MNARAVHGFLLATGLCFGPFAANARAEASVVPTAQAAPPAPSVPPPAPATPALPSVPSTPLIYKDPDRPIPERVADLIRRMTLEEKAASLDSDPPTIERLGILGCSFRNEGMHGVYKAGRATTFPHSIALAATWSTALIQRVGSAIGDEARVKFAEAPTRRNYGVICWAPPVDLVRDPRWGRVQETYGEDPHLVSQSTRAFIRGLQGDDPKYLKVAATVKHFVVYGQETDRRATNLVVSARTLREYYLAPFQATLAKGGASSVMTAFTALNGTPCVMNPFLLKKILREEWGFEGPAVSDVNASVNLKEHYQCVGSLEEGVAQAVAAGIDVVAINKGTVFSNALQAVKQGLLPEAQLDRALTRSLTLRFRLGMFDPPEQTPWTKISPSALGSPEHVALAREASGASLVLLKNDRPAHRADPAPLLPLDRRRLDSIAVLGFYADRIELGTLHSAEPAQPIVSVLAGIRNHVGARVLVRSAPWFDADAMRRSAHLKPDALAARQKAAVEEAVNAAARSDVAVVVLGLSRKNESEGKDRLTLDLPKDQQDFVEKIVAANPATVVVLLNGGCLAVNWIQKHVPAILEAWYPGEQGGNAIADALFGDINPAGRLPITFYAALDTLPLTECEINRGRTYLYLKTPPLWPFGHGLSYSRFDYAKLRVARETAEGGDALRVSLEVKNAGARDGEEVVQCYVRAPDAPWPTPIHQLRAFQRLAIPAGETRAVDLSVPLARLASWDEDANRWTLRPGRYEIQVGASSADLRLRASVDLE